MNFLIRSAVLWGALFVVFGCETICKAPVPIYGYDPPKPARHHMISAANPHAARAGLEMLRAGGSAVDAAIAAQMVLTLVEPQSSGIGGGAFLLHYRAGNARRGWVPEVEAYDGREVTPAAATPRMFQTQAGNALGFRDRIVGGTATGVPGVLHMLETVHRKHGKLKWARLFDAAIDLAEKGFEISSRLESSIVRHKKRLARFPAARAYFLLPDGKRVTKANPRGEIVYKARSAGSVLTNAPLAALFRRIAVDGPDAFYKGEVAADMARTVSTTAHRPIAMTTADIADYRAVQRKILCRPYRRWRICTMPPPTSGGIATLQILTIVEPFDMGALSPGSAQAVHLISEASRLAFADRNQYVADPDFVTIPVAGLLDKGYLAHRGRQISVTRSMGKASPGLPPRTDARNLAPDTAVKPVSTSHISVVDRAGNAVSMTTSVGGAFGSGLMTHGFVLNSQIADFAAEPEKSGVPVANRVEPGKRPRSSMSPTLVLDRNDQLVMAIGSPGGSHIIGYVTKALIAVLDWKLHLRDAVALPNHTNRNGKTNLEKGSDLEDIAERLGAMGHEVRLRSLTSGLQGIRVTRRGLRGGADPRREGVVLGE